MGLYPAECIGCKKTFLWFSGNLAQVCDECKARPLPTTPSDDKPKWREFWLGRTDMARDYIREYAPDDQREYIHVIESAAVVAAEAQLTDCNKIINNLHQQVQRAEAEIARMKEGLNSPAEQAMQGTCEVCGTTWRSDEFLPCPVCKPALAGQCLNCDAEFEMSNSGCMDLLRKERAKLTDAEREIASEKSIAEHWKGNMNLARNERDYFQAENERLTKENAELKAMLNAANEILHDQDVHPAIAERNILTKQNEEQAKEIVCLQFNLQDAQSSLVNYKEIVGFNFLNIERLTEQDEEQSEIIAAMESALKGCDDQFKHGYRGNINIAAEALAKLAEH